LTDWSVQPRMLPAGRIKCGPAGTPSRTNFPSLSSRAFGCGPTNPGSLDGAVIRNCVASGGDVAADGKLATPEIVAPGVRTIAMSLMSPPPIVTGTDAYCGPSPSLP